MGFLSGPPPAPPPPPPPPPAANPPTYANAGIQATAKQRSGAAKGAGFEGSLFTGPQGIPAQIPTAQKQLMGQ